MNVDFDFCWLFASMSLRSYTFVVVICFYIVNLQLGVNGYSFVINHNGFVVFHPRLRLIQV